MSKDIDPKTPQEKESHGLFHRLFGWSHGSGRSHRDDGARAAAIWKTSRASFSAPTACRSCGISCSKWTVPAAARKLLGRLVSGDETDAPQITTAKDWHVGLEPGPGDDLTAAPAASPTIA